MVARLGGGRLGGGYTPFGRRRPVSNHPIVHMQEQSSPQLPARSILIGKHLNSFTGEVIGEAWLPLPTQLYKTNEAICIEGEPGAGKSMLIRVLAEYFSKEEGRCVIIIDVTKDQYYPFNQPQNDPILLQILKDVGLAPTSIPEVEVYAPIYDVPTVGEDVMRRDFHATKFLSIKTSGLTSRGFFELGDIDPKGRVYKLYLDAMLNVPEGQKTAPYILSELRRLKSDPSLGKSIEALERLFRPLWEQGIIRDDGTDVREMLHPPRKGRAGKISVINLITTEPDDNRKNALVSALLNQIFNIIKKDRTIRPVIMCDEIKEIAPKKAVDSPATYGIFGNFHRLSRAWGATKVYGFQYRQDVADYILRSPYLIQLTQSLTFGYGNSISGKGLGKMFINGTGDKALEAFEKQPIYLQTYPSRTRHID